MLARRALEMALLAVLTLPAQVESVAAHDCKCRSGGVNYPQGALVCVRGKLARCEMFLNNSSWKVVADACPQSRRFLPSSQHGAQSAKVLQPLNPACRASDAEGAPS